MNANRDLAWNSLSPLLKHCVVVCLLVISSACAINPVTGKRELQLVSRGSEISMGEKNYIPAQQSQGGQYVVDQDLATYVSSVGRKLVAVSDRPKLPYEFVVLNNSVPNAWAMPGGKIAINRGLLIELDNEAELAAVLAHEIVHAAARHGAKAVERGMALQVGAAGVGVAVAGSKGEDLMVGAAMVSANLINLRYGRKHELESDYFGMLYMSKAGYDPRAAVTLQQKFVRLSNNKEPNWLTGLFASHPPSQERVDTNRETLKQLPAGGRTGRDTYRNKIARLKKTKKAYQRFDKGNAALKKGASSQALDHANAALAVEPREALFSGLRGDAFLKQKKYRKALAEYNKALRHNDTYYRFYLQRGMVRKQLGLLEQARQDYSKSNALLPTANAHYALGELALRQNQRQEAMVNFQEAASSQSDLGRRASLALTGMDLPNNPAKYFVLEQLQDEQGTILVRVQSNSPLTVKQVKVRVTVTKRTGQVVDGETLTIPARLKPGRRYLLRTRLRFDPARQHIYTVTSQVVSAAVVEVRPAPN